MPKLQTLRTRLTHKDYLCRPMVYVSAGLCDYFKKIEQAAIGKGKKAGGLDKKAFGDIMHWAYEKGIIEWQSLYTTNPTRSNRKKLKSSATLRRSLNFWAYEIMDRMARDQ